MLILTLTADVEAIPLGIAREQQEYAFKRAADICMRAGLFRLELVLAHSSYAMWWAQDLQERGSIYLSLFQPISSLYTPSSINDAKWTLYVAFIDAQHGIVSFPLFLYSTTCARTEQPTPCGRVKLKNLYVLSYHIRENCSSTDETSSHKQTRVICFFMGTTCERLLEKKKRTFPSSFLWG